MEKLVQCRALAAGHVVDLCFRVRAESPRGKQVCLNYVLDVAEIAASLPVAVDKCGLSVAKSAEPAGDDRRIRPGRILSGTKDVEVS